VIEGAEKGNSSKGGIRYCGICLERCGPAGGALALAVTAKRDDQRLVLPTFTHVRQRRVDCCSVWRLQKEASNMRKKIGAIGRWRWIHRQGLAGLNWGDVAGLVVLGAMIVAVGLLALEGAASPSRQGGWAGIDAGGWEVGVKALYVLVWMIGGAAIGLGVYDESSSAGLMRQGWSRRLVVMAAAAVSLALGVMSLPVVDLAGAAWARRMGIESSIPEARAAILGTLSSVAVLTAYSFAAFRRIERWSRNDAVSTQVKYMVHAAGVMAGAVTLLVVTKVMTGVLAAAGG
jgi:hypothetical protein